MSKAFTSGATQVWAVGQQEYDFAKAFSPDGASGATGANGVYYSHVFQVDNNFVRIAAFDLIANETVTIQQVAGEGIGQYVADYAPVNGPIQLTYQRTSYILERPGRYRLRLNGEIDRVKVIGFRFAMENESNGDIADAFRTSAHGTAIQLLLCQDTGG